MENIKPKREVAIGLRARVPALIRGLALFVLIAGVVYVGVSYYRHRGYRIFNMISQPPQLSTDETGRVEGYEQRITDANGRLMMWVRASRDITYSDAHHELENVNLAIYPSANPKAGDRDLDPSKGDPNKPDVITANRAILPPKGDDDISFIGNVKVETRDALKIETELVKYNRTSKVAQTDSLVNFNRENVSGHSTGAVLDSKAQQLELRKDVVITVVPEQKATPDQKPKPPSTRSRPVTISAGHALFEEETKKLSFSGGVTGEQETDVMSGDAMYAMLNEKKKLQKLEVRNNSYLRTMNPGHAGEVHATNMDFFLDDDQRLTKAIASGDTRARSLDADSEVQLNGANVIETNYQSVGDQSLLQSMHTQGRAVVTMAAPKSRANDPRAANKRMTADDIKLEWRPQGRDLSRMEATGNAELYVEPVMKSEKADRKTLTAPRFDCDFYEVGNLAHNFVATGGAKAVIDPVQPSEKRGPRTITSQKMTAAFVRETQDVERVEAQGDMKFNERDRNGAAAAGVYTAADDMIRLRGGDPVVWDSRARTKAAELDSDLADQVSYSRGHTATTYYSQEQTNGATPFTKVKSPVYIVSERGEFHHDTGVAIYTGNARAWQDDNFVRSDKL